MKHRNIRPYRLHAAGHLWELAAARLSTLPDGTEAISAEETERVHRAVANAICGRGAPLAFSEFAFLCDVTGTTWSEAAAHLGLHKSTVSTWRRRGEVPSRVIGDALKRFFWFKLFGKHLGQQTVPLASFASDPTFLEVAAQAAVAARLSEQATLQEAS